MNHKMTLGEVVRWDPAVLDLIALARSIQQEPSGGFCANAVWYGRPHFPGLKLAIRRSVGTNAERWPSDHPMRSRAAYDAACDAVYAALPNCDHEGDCWGDHGLDLAGLALRFPRGQEVALRLTPRRDGRDL